jgi:cellulose synthase/poly-beta-1,6-N-acetylglucosamine synthase-like glycosyltransferase
MASAQTPVDVPPGASPVAIAVVAGIAVLPGYLNAQLLVSLALDRPPPVQVDDTTLPPVTVLVATCDADTLLMPFALRNAVARLERAPEDTVAVAGSVMVRNSRRNWLTAMQSWDFLIGIGSVEPTAIAFTDVPAGIRGLVRQRRRWARGMIEGLRHHGARLLGSRRLYAHAVGVNFAFPLLDLTFSLAFPAGLLLAATGNFMIVGPMTLAVMPLNAVIIGLMYSPVSLSGYLTELVRRPRRW